MAHFKTPDYCIITKAETLDLLRLELQNLCAEGGIFYAIYSPVNKTEDLAKEKLTYD